MTRKALIVYYSKTGKTKEMANWIIEILRREGIKVTVREAPSASAKEFLDADALLIGTPTYFSNVCWQEKKLIDETYPFYAEKKLRGKLFGSFTSSANREDTKEALAALDLAFRHHHEMISIPGIISVDDEPERDVRIRCKDYARKIVSEIHNVNRE